MEVISVISTYIKLASSEPTSAVPTSSEPTSEELTSSEPTSAVPSLALPSSLEPTSEEASSEEPSSSEPTSEEANLIEADLSGAILIRANLSGATLSRADLSGAALSEADLSGAKGYRIERRGGSLLKRLQRSIRTLFPQKEEKQKQQGIEALVTLNIHIEEEPLTASHLSETLNTLISLYVKMWLLEQDRFDDFVQYTEGRDRRFEKEANLVIAELKYNSPIDIKLIIDPKALSEALQTFVDMIMQRKQRQRAMELKLLKEELDILDQGVETVKHVVETLAPGLDEDQKSRAMQSLMVDILKLTRDPTLQLSLTPSSLSAHIHPKQTSEARQPFATSPEQAVSEVKNSNAV